ncbi:MAG TPA: SgcJ/EcaC family oxidoreductase [Gemmatimonadaceae bacterium]|nr:SgcJ/EcaC family oxidoreductase [Gemmatimonadaceae bacterium]
MNESGEPSSSTVIDLYARMLAGWNRRDADAFAAVFAHTSLCVGFDGSQMHGRDEIARELRAIFAHHQTASYVARVRSVRQLDVHVALLHAVVGMVPPGQHELNPAANAVQCVVVAMVAGEPKIVLLQNTPAAFHGRPELVERMTAELTEVLRTGREGVGDRDAQAEDHRDRGGSAG